MKKYEKLILLCVGFLLLAKIASFGRDAITAYAVGTAEMTDMQKTIWSFASLLIGFLPNLAAAIWLFVERTNLRRWIWSLFGFCFGLVAVVLYYVLQMHCASINREQI